MLGARYDGHPWNTARDHRSTRSVVPRDQALWRRSLRSPTSSTRRRNTRATKIRVLLRLDVSKMPANPNLQRTDGDFPLAWAKSYGKGRVFYSSLGHASATWDNRTWTHVFRGVEMGPGTDRG